jgi:hypothetical protein
VDAGVFFLRHSFLVFFDVGDAGDVSSVLTTYDLPFFHGLFGFHCSPFMNVFTKVMGLSFLEGVTATSLIF